jgi:tyrosinase
MRFTFLTACTLQAATAVLGAVLPRDDAPSLQDLEDLAKQAFETIKENAEADQGLEARAGTCQWSQVRIRKEWDSLSLQERKNYIAAVKCLQSKPAKTPAQVAPGAKTRFDDFVATHINQTTTIHYTANFLSWHRYFAFLYEEALRTECGYKGTQPYWNWARTAITGMEKSPIFDGSATSMSGNGEFVKTEGDIILGASMGLPPIYLPTGTGGGCVKSGPFKDMVVNLGPAALDLPGGTSEANPNGPLSHNPRCLKRDLTDAVNRQYANVAGVLDLILKSKTVEEFQLNMQGAPGSGSIGVHGGGHYSIGGNPGRDVFTSPGDPIFYLHHSMIDRVWWIWQSLNPSERARGESAIAGTRTFFNMPPSENATLDDLLEYGYAAGPPIPIRDALDTLSGPFCYVYQ